MFIADKTLFAFISTGAETKMFTLRTMIKGHIHTPRGLTIKKCITEYHKNLSVNFDEAQRKAKAFAQKLGIPFKLLPNLKVELNTIERITPEMLDHRKWEQEQARIEVEAQKQAKIEQQHNEFSRLQFTMDSEWLFGKYNRTTQTIGSVLQNDTDYIRWLFANYELPFTTLTSHLEAQLNWMYENIQLEPKEEKESNWIGKVGETVTLVGRCTNAYENRFEVAYNTYSTQYLYVLEDDDGNIIKISYSGYKWEMEKGKTYKFTGKIKKHDQYHETKQTALFYVKNVSEEK